MPNTNLKRIKHAEKETNNLVPNLQWQGFKTVNCYQSSPASCLLPPVTISRFLANICGNFMLICGIFCNFMLLCVFVCTFLVFWAFYAVLLRINFCRNLRTFLSKIILAPNLLVLKLCLFAYLAFYLLLFSKY